MGFSRAHAVADDNTAGWKRGWPDQALARRILMVLAFTALSACRHDEGPAPGPTLQPSPTAIPTPPPRRNSSPTASATPTPAPTPTPSPRAAPILRIEGVVSGPSLPAGSEVSVQIGPRQITAQLDATGGFALSLSDYAESDFVIVSARGSGASARIEWASVLGSAGDLRVRAGADARLVPSEQPALRLSGLSTAIYGLLTQTNVPGLGKQLRSSPSPRSDAELQAALRLLEPAGLIGLATTLDFLARHPDEPLPEGIETTAQLAASAVLRQVATERLVVARQADYAAQLKTTLATATRAAFSAASPANAAFVWPSGYGHNSYRLVFDAAGTGSLITDWSGAPGALNRNTDTFRWAYSPDGALELIMDTGITSERHIDVTGDGVDERVIVRMQAVRFWPFLNQPGYRFSAIETRGQDEYPDNPELGARLFGYRVDGALGDFAEFGALALDSGLSPYGQRALLNSVVLLPIYNSAGGQNAPGSQADAQADALSANLNATPLGGGALIDYVIPGRNAFAVHDFFYRFQDDLFHFAPDGTGQSEYLKLDFTWTVQADGSLEILTDDGTLSQYRRVLQLGQSPQYIVQAIHTPPTGTAFAVTGLSATLASNSRFVAPNFAGEFHSWGIGTAALRPTLIYEQSARLRPDGDSAYRLRHNLSADGSITIEDSPIYAVSEADGRLSISQTADQLAGNADADAARNCDPARSPSCEVTAQSQWRLIARAGQRHIVLTRHTQSADLSGREAPTPFHYARIRDKGP